VAEEGRSVSPTEWLQRRCRLLGCIKRAFQTQSEEFGSRKYSQTDN